jgi:hypothetical protein
MNVVFRGVENICNNCPVVTIIGSDMQQLMGQSYAPDELNTVRDLAANHLLNVADINYAAGTIGCRDKEKELPEVLRPMPPIGSPERIAYGRHCLAYVALRKSHSQD